MLLAKRTPILFGCAALLFVVMLFTPSFVGRAYADKTITCSDNKTTITVSDSTSPDTIEQKCKDAVAAASSGESQNQGQSPIVKTPNNYNPNPVTCSLNKDGSKTCTDCDEKANCITKDIQKAVNVLAAGVGIVVTIVIVFAGIQYTTSRDNPQVVQAAKTRILNAVIALVAFMFIYAFLQWLVPGGLF